MATTARKVGNIWMRMQAHHPHPPPLEAEAREGVGRDHAEEDGQQRRRPGDDDHVDVPVLVGDVERRLARSLLTRVAAQDRAEVVERDVLRDQARAGERVDRVERGRDDVEDREDRERDRDEADEIAPPVCGEARPASATHGGASGRNRLGLFERGHRTVSSPFVRQNEIAEMPATMKKMKIDTAAASPYWAPWPAENASLYV